MENKIKIIIPNVEELDSEQYDILISVLDSLPLDYERWDCVQELGSLSGEKKNGN